MAIFIFIMIGVGGYTRLSQSGLSMVEWKPVTGWLPPLSDMAWENSFAKYKNSPEFIKVNHQMSTEEYKDFFYVEYFHRLLGRILGLLFFIPFIVFTIQKKLSQGQFWLYLGIGTLGGIQGFVGWFMVKSGLINEPSVSAHRLCLHLSLGGLLFWLCLKRFADERWQQHRHQTTFGYLSLGACAIQIMSGAFVSGNHAGHALSTLLLGHIEPLWVSSMGLHNLFDNVVTILLHHLTWGILTTALLITYIIKLRTGFKLQSKFVSHSIGLQVTLGVITLLTYSPERSVLFCLLHQLGAFILVASLTLSMYDSRPSSHKIRQSFL